MNTYKYKKAMIRDAPTGKWLCRIEPAAALNGVELQGTVYIGFASYMNRGQIRGYGEIGRYCSIGRDVSIGLGVHDLTQSSTSPFFRFRSGQPMEKFVSLEPKRRTIIGNDVWIGDGVRINSGVRIGDGAIIATGAVVTKDVEPYSIVGGLPAKFLRWRFSEDIRKEFLELEWWKYEPGIVKEILVPDPHQSILNLKSRLSEVDLFPIKYRSIRPSH